MLVNFLSGRGIQVVDGHSSSLHKMNTGVPQDSALNDLLFATNNTIHNFADDSTLHS